ncbi:hypothetical protein PFMALIP_02912 [Plasmodium falciparum MaliPS096_E11]|uniref:Uncharacterized protein n=1 Tax=Plasmodium falciparum MaliPS096_E11 TaxID=1036727 RepID=A0A024WQR8_PLAFA|nr:hypothetical protein PFMALIP_02912 [Plasmodium falciparum MaliPS096_E11]
MTLEKSLDQEKNKTEIENTGSKSIPNDSNEGANNKVDKNDGNENVMKKNEGDKNKVYNGTADNNKVDNNKVDNNKRTCKMKFIHINEML